MTRSLTRGGVARTALRIADPEPRAMTKTVECFYVLSSPWMYLGGPKLEDIVRRNRARLVLRPYEWLVVTEQTGGISLRTRPQARQDYHALELARWRDYLGMPLSLTPKFYPTDNRAAARMVIAAQARGLDAMPLSHALLRALWVEDRDIRDAAVRAAIANESGFDGPVLQAAEDAPETVAAFNANSADAVARGIFGSPTYMFRGERFWGQDRLDFLDRALMRA
jgi:2-hydroxychromene-2-carboxylate isomerase